MATVAFLLALSLGAEAAAIAPTVVPVDQLESEPYRHAGLVRTESFGADPTVLGSGWVASERVVSSAAHVFFVEETLGWNRNRWYWRRAAPPGTFGDTPEMLVPRAYRVQSGYADAAARYVNDPSKIGDAFNRDAIVLLFYRAASESLPPPRAVDALNGTGTYNLVGYPAELNGVAVPNIAMHAHQGGQTATFTRNGSASDYLGRPNIVSRTTDLTSGPGGSGGPVFKLVGGAWTVVGTLVGGTSDGSAAIVRAIDPELDQFIRQAIDDSVAPGPGQVLWEAPSATEVPPVFRADGSVVLVSYDAVRALADDGIEVWHHSVPSSLSRLAEAPDGRILTGSSGTVIALRGDTGEELWRTGIPRGGEIAVGPVGEIYASDDRRMMRVSPRGTVDWEVEMPGENVYNNVRVGPAIGPDGTVFAIIRERLHAVDPATGALKWRTDPFAPLNRASLAAGLDGSVTVASDSNVARFDPDGSLLWNYPTNGLVDPEQILVRGDGSVVLLEVHDGLLVLNADGTVMSRLPLASPAYSFTCDAAGNFYIGSSEGVECRDPGGEVLWNNTEARIRTYLGQSGILMSWADIPATWLALGANGPAAADTWQPRKGGPDSARRVLNTAPVPPRIVATPEATRVVTGYRLELEVTAEGSFPLEYQWYHNGTLLAGQFGQRLIIRETTLDDAGEYTVTVRNEAGSITSEPVPVVIGGARFGDLLWSTTLQTDVRPAVGDDGSVYVLAFRDEPGSSGRKIFSLVALDSGGTELWQHELARGGSSYRATPPILGDDGRIYVAGTSTIHAFARTGTELWNHELPVGSIGWPLLALARDNGVYFFSGFGIGLVSPEGVLRWHKTGISRAEGFFVRRDGALVIAPQAIIRTDGTIESYGAQYSNGRFGMLGPQDDWILTLAYDGGVTLGRDGSELGRNPDSIHDTPLFMLSDGTVVTDRLRLEPYLGTGSHMLEPRGVEPIAVLAGDRILIQKDNLTQVINSSSEILAEATNTKWGHFTATSDGILYGGAIVAAYHLGWPLANTAWPSPRGDARNTNRAPVDFVLTSPPPKSVEVRGQTDPFNRYDSQVQFHHGSMTGYLGYSAVLSASIDGSGPFEITWEKNGVPLGSSGVHSQLEFTALDSGDAGDYAVKVSNSGGTVFSSTFHLEVVPPVPVTPGTYVRMWTNPGFEESPPCVFVVTADRRVRLEVFREGGFRAEARILPNGAFTSVYENSPVSIDGTISGAAITLYGSAPLPPLETPLSGNAPNGLPAGLYRGHALGPSGLPTTIIVFADGRFLWLQGPLKGYSRTASGIFPTNSLKSTFVDTSQYNAIAYALSARADGAIVGRRTTESSSLLDDTGFVALWSERPRVERLINLSSRGYVSPEQPPMIVGFFVTGTTSHSLLLRGAGPALTKLGVTNPLPHPHLRLVPLGGNELDQNAGWSTRPDSEEIRAAAARVFAFPFENQSRDSALLTSLGPGGYTALVNDVGGGSGVVLVEAYEDLTTSGGGSRLANLSTRGTVSRGERVLIGGFYVSGDVPKSMLIRAAGPALAPFAAGAFNVAADPILKIHRVGSSDPIAIVDNVWSSGNDQEIHDAARRVGAFPFVQGSLDAAIVLALEPGGYTAVVENLTDEDGVALLEIYELSSGK